MASIKQRLPYGGRGRIHNNEGFWMIQVLELDFVNGQSIKVDRTNSSAVVEYFVEMAKYLQINILKEQDILKNQGATVLVFTYL